MLVVWFCLLGWTFLEARVTYDGYKLFRVVPQTEAQLQFLTDERRTSVGVLDFWLATTAVNQSADVLVPPSVVSNFVSKLETRGLLYTVLITDLQALLREDSKKIVEVPQGLEMFANYSSIKEINVFMTTLASSHPECVSVLEIGASSLGRPLRVLKVARGEGATKPVIWIHGGTHARERIGVSVVAYIATKLAAEHEKNEEVSRLVDTFDWFLLPALNPDGYEYARTIDPLWRKTRSEDENSSCLGVDPNRNWDIHWNDHAGSSPNPCAQTYAGRFPFSEPETRSVARFLLSSLKGRLRLFLDLHSYSQRWLAPYGYTSELPPNYDQQEQLAKTATEALEKVFGTKYSVGSTGNIMYTVTGGARDWVYDVIGADFSYVVELRDNGLNGFPLSRTQILPTAIETWEGIKAMANRLRSM